MTKFEMIGIEWQQDAVTTRDAVRAFNRSCYDCCIRGMTIDCNRCAIRQSHQQTVAILSGSGKMTCYITKKAAG